MGEHNVSIEVLIGKEIEPYIEHVGQLRIETFKHYPYLYEGNMAIERDYIGSYAADEKATLAIIRVDSKIAGVSTGIPLGSSSGIVAEPQKVLQQQNIDIKDYYYYGDVIMAPQYRGMRLAEKMLIQQDEVIKKWGFKYICVLTVVREADHSLKPKDYISIDKIAERHGFRKNNLFIVYRWPTILPDKSVKDMNNTLQFWTKKLV